MGPDADDEVMSRLVIEHEDLDETIDEIELLIRRGEQERLREAAAVLADQLEAHFAHEEHSPLFTTIATNDPEVGSRVEVLLHEHVEMRASMRDLLESEDIAARLLDLMRKLDAHEKIEMALLERAFARVDREPR
jgi:hypothetical protein